MGPTRLPNTAATRRLHQLLTSGFAHHQRGALVAAAARYREILVTWPRCFDALHLLGVTQIDGGAIEDGVELIRRAIAVDPTQANAHLSLARALLKQGETGSALAGLDQATASLPLNADLWALRGNALQRAGRAAESLTCYEHACRLAPATPETFNNLAAALRSLRRLDPALEAVNLALEQRPAYAMALNNRGLIHLDRGEGAAAVADFRRAVHLEQRFAEALHNCGTALTQLRRYEEAAEVFTGLLAQCPQFKHVPGNLLHARLSSCDWDRYRESVDSVTTAVACGAHGDLPQPFLAVTDSAALQLQCARSYVSTYFPPQPATVFPERKAGGRLRIGYLSGDLGEHAVTYLLAGVLERHDHERFETIALAWTRRADGPLRRRLEAAFSRFIDIGDLPDADAARLIRDREVDVLVDLCGHTRGNRTGILAHRPAPLQVSFLGHPATSGSPYIDYLIADRFLVPEEDEQYYSERIVRMPGSFQPYDDRREPASPPRTRGEEGLPAAALVLCSFNGNYKLNPAFFDVWARLLQAQPTSVLWLVGGTPAAERNLRREAAARGVDPDRLVFARPAPYATYLARYSHADLFLDSLPYNGGTTVSDALSMAVPVLTCAGRCFAARMAGSVLTDLGFSDLVTQSLADYEAKAIELVTDPGRLAALRRVLCERRRTHAFFNSDRYRRHLESAFQAMWARHAAGLPPAAIDVAPVDHRIEP